MSTEDRRAEDIVRLASDLGFGRVTPSVSVFDDVEVWAVDFPEDSGIDSIVGEPGPGSYQHVRAQLIATRSARSKRYTGLERRI